MSLNEDMRTLASAKARLNQIESELLTHEESDHISEWFQLKYFIDKTEAEIRAKFAVKKQWFTITTGNFEVLENERLCRKALDEKPFVMPYDIRKKFRIMPWHWIAWRSLKMDQIDAMEADE